MVGTVAILAQGTNRADAFTQAFLVIAAGEPQSVFVEGNRKN